LYQIDITEPAEKDIIETVKYIFEQLLNPTAAGKLVDDIEKAIYSLADMPQRHALVKDDDLAGLGFRFMPVNKYLVFYVIREERNTVVIQRVLYGRRDWVAILKNEAIL
jgi:addiction module RelE/StbE family toxin